MKAGLRLKLVAAHVAGVAVLVACGSNSGTSGGAPSAGGAEPTQSSQAASCGGAIHYTYCYTITMTVTGDKTDSGGDSIPSYQQSCTTWMAAFSAKNGGHVDLPVLVVSASNRVGAGVTVLGWTGPGTYDFHGPSQGVGLSEGVLVVDGEYYSPGPLGNQASKLTATVRADGSATVMFSGFGNVADPSRIVSGTITYDCREG